MTLWRAPSAEDAIESAEEEARAYCEDLEQAEYLGLAQSYELPDPPEHGREVFSLMRESALNDTRYLDAFFDTGTERQGHIGPRR